MRATEGAKGSVCPVGTCHRRWQSDPERDSETMSATVREARMIEQPGRKKRGLMQEDAGGRQRFRRQSPSSVASDRREQETRVFPMIMFFEIEAARPLRVEDGRAVYVSCKKVRYLSEARFLCPSGTRNARFFVLRHRAWGAAPNPGRRAGKRVPCGHLGRRPKATRSGAAKP